MMNNHFNGDQLLALFEALSNPHRLRIISILAKERKYVSQLAREAEMSRPLLYMHLQKLENADLVKTEMEVSNDGKAMKYYEIIPFHLEITKDVIKEAAQTITIKKKLRKKR